MTIETDLLIACLPDDSSKGVTPYQTYVAYREKLDNRGDTNTRPRLMSEIYRALIQLRDQGEVSSTVRTSREISGSREFAVWYKTK